MQCFNLYCFQSAVRFMKNITDAARDEIDFIVWTGDDLSHAPEEVFTKQETLDTIAIISQQLASVNLPVFPSLGNHDIIPKNQVLKVVNIITVSNIIFAVFHRHLD